MGLVESVLGYAKSLIIIESKISRLQADVHDMAAALEIATDKLGALSERVAKIEGKFEAYESMAQRAEVMRKEIEAPKGGGKKSPGA